MIVIYLDKKFSRVVSKEEAHIAKLLPGDDLPPVFVFLTAANRESIQRLEIKNK